MNSLKSKNSLKTIKRWNWITMLLIGILTLGIISCNNDNDDTNNSNDESETAWIIGYRTETPQGKVYYLEANENIPSETNASQAVELGLNNRIYSYGGNPYTWSGDAGTITKWEVDKSTLALTPSGIVSFASVGVTGNIAGPAFISETQAFTTNLAEGLVVEWNPSTMEIIKIYNVDAFPIPEAYDGLLFEFSKEVTADGKIIIPIETNAFPLCCTYPPDAVGARTAIFDPGTGIVTYHVDDRLFGSNNHHLTDRVTGTRYAIPVYNNSFVAPYFDNAETLPNPHSLLKVNDDGTFDANYEYNLDEVLDIEFYYDTPFIYDNKIVFTYVGNDYTWPSFDERYYVIFTGNFKSVVVDLETDEVQSFNAFSKYTSARVLGVFDGQSYFAASTSNSDGTRDDYILQQNAIDDYTEVAKHKNGNIEHINKLW
ncbi:hypothetical protein ACSTS3_06160 [Aquimarina muelleri]|uniref:hypothetical protein n=1 Tax=Aquimarina muelleri TaxID=279356 RepID=UPI003F687261